jgi:O-antigen ligase
MTDVVTATGGRLARVRRGVSRHLATRQPAEAGTARGLLWILFVGYEFYLLSNPIAVLGPWDDTWAQAQLVAVAMLVVQLPWLRLPRVPAVLWAFMALTALSVGWSISPGTTWSAVLLYGTLAVLGLVIAANVSARVLAWGCLAGGAGFLAASVYAFVEKIPSALILPGMNGHLAGASANRNILSYCMVLSFGFAVAYLPRHWASRVAWGLGVAALLVGLYLAESVTGYAAVLILACQGVMLTVLRRWSRPVRRRVLLGIAGAVSAVVAVMVLVPNAFTDATGRDSTLSGRMTLWQAIIEESWDNPLFGVGWGAVWRHPWLPAPDNDVVVWIYAGAGDYVYHGHNSLFDVLPQLGVVGVLLLIWMHVLPLRRAVLLRAHPDSGSAEHTQARLMITVTTALLLCGATEAMTSIPLGWFALTMMLEMAARRRPSRGRRARSVA